MPCRDYDDGLSTYQIQQIKIDTLTRMLCETLTHVDESGYKTILNKRSKEVTQWWNEHQERDRKRRIAEGAELRRKSDKKAALAKLTPQERKLLGL